MLRQDAVTKAKLLRKAITMTEKSQAFEHLRFAMTEWVQLSELQWQTFSNIFYEKQFSANEQLLQPGSTTYELMFVSEGLLRFYYLSEEGIESNKAFVTEGNFAGPLAASGLNLPIMYGVEALETTTVLAADLQVFSSLFEEHPVFDRFGRMLAELILQRKELRTRSLLQKTAKQRYVDFRKDHPELLKRVPQFQIASYLGVTEVSLSRIKRELVQEQFA